MRLVEVPPPIEPEEQPDSRRAGATGRHRMVVGLGVTLVAVLALAGGAWWARASQPAPAPAAPTASGISKLTARGQIRPVKKAKVRTIVGGVLHQVSVEVGQAVQEQQEIARVQNAAGTEVLTAPWSGTISDLPARLGDTVMPGSVVALVADLTRLQVETTDVDEFLIAQIRRGQEVTLTVDAFPGRLLRGTVRSTALETETTSTGDEQYPVVIDLAGFSPDLRPGMNVRVSFGS